jgi:HD superfamily phosphohydrolase
VSGKEEPHEISAFIGQMRQELRLAALLHDTGHSLHSHASEQVYSEIPLLKTAIDELSTFVGKEKGAGEVLSFCLARTSAISEMLDRAESKLIPSDPADEENGSVSMSNVSLLIVGRSQHPLLQFLGDIISSGFDADKLDYLLRDASAAGLPLRYDLERYLFTVFLDQDILVDDEEQLEKLYAAVGSHPERNPKQEGLTPFPFYSSYRLRLPKLAMSTIEQIIICKLMLFSYIYHHPKVRAAETLLVRLLRLKYSRWQQGGYNDEAMLRQFLSMSDSSLDGTEFRLSGDEIVASYSYRILYRLLPRQVYRLSAAATGDRDGALLKNYFTRVEDKAQRRANIEKLEMEIGKRLLQLDESLGVDPEGALRSAGVWVDVPKVPKFEDVSVIVGRSKGAPGVKIADVFPIGQWTEAYEAHRFYIRIYAFSEHCAVAQKAARAAIEAVIGITSDGFFEAAGKDRTTA